MKRRHLTTFGHVFRHSLVPYDNYYGKVLHNTPISFSLKYFFALSTMLVLIELLVAFVGFGKMYPFFQLDTGIRSVVEQIPNDLVVNFNGNRLNTNSERPIIIFNPDITMPGTLLVIDQNATREKIDEYQSQYLFTGKEFVMRSNGRLMSYEYGDTRFGNSQLAIPLGEVARNATLYITALYLAAVLALPILATVARLVVLYAISFIGYVLCIKIIPRLRVTKVFQISLHASTAPIVIQSFITVLGLKVPLSFWWFSAMTIIFLIAAVYESYILSEHK